jgi:uncharacterized YigZ family protein
MITDEFYTIKDTRESEIKVKGSSFIGIASPVSSREEAEQFLSAIQKKYFDATHHCYAYQTGYGADLIFRYSDDGEPSGTAGKPIYHVITGCQLTNLIVVVTRYFGGTKLGTGGLARAYSGSATDVLSRCDIITQIIYQTVHFRFPYDETSTVMRLICSLECKINETKYDTLTEMDVDVRAGKVDAFCAQLIDMTRGKATIVDSLK